MTSGDLPNNLKQFIFDWIDSVEQIDVLLFLKNQSEQSHNPETISRELRTSLSSVKARLSRLVELGLAEDLGNQTFKFRPKTSELKSIVDALEEAYKVRRHTVLDLVFSAAKRARPFANAFVISKDKKDNGDG